MIRTKIPSPFGRHIPILKLKALTIEVKQWLGQEISADASKLAVLKEKTQLSRLILWKYKNTYEEGRPFFEHGE